MRFYQSQHYFVHAVAFSASVVYTVPNLLIFTQVGGSSTTVTQKREKGHSIVYDRCGGFEVSERLKTLTWILYELFCMVKKFILILQDLGLAICEIWIRSPISEISYNENFVSSEYDLQFL